MNSVPLGTVGQVRYDLNQVSVLLDKCVILYRWDVMILRFVSQLGKFNHGFDIKH